MKKSDRRILRARTHTRALQLRPQRYGARVRVWDNGGKTADRYTIIAPASAWRTDRNWHGGDAAGLLWDAIAASERPFHPQGFGQHTSAAPGAHLGKRIQWDALPPDVQRFARETWPQFCPAVPA